MAVRDISTKPYLDQKSGTAGLRKKVAVFQQPHYLENFLQAIFDCVPNLHGGTLVIGGDGRYYNRTAIQTACAVAAGNGVTRIVVGQGGLLSTPAASHLIRKRQAQGGFLFTASHNPAGADGDFGIKFNVSGGGQASEGLTNRIYETSKMLTRYRVFENGAVDLDRRGLQTLGSTEIEIVDCVDDYAQLMQQLFDFDRIRDWFKRGHSLRFDAMHAVTGPYAERIFVDQLGAPLLS
ncbi:MAG TPA: alpha-D-glucose phosphate-specific phosphoglucomutase, partial [Solimonas sp.]|nr:alpha-D-glucose phosphate-specific phosphoglucomutase [Solimonas sp.]